MRSVIDIVDLSVEEINDLIATANDINDNPAKYAEKCILCINSAAKNSLGVHAYIRYLFVCKRKRAVAFAQLFLLILAFP